MYKTENWWVSPFNFEEEVLKPMNLPKKVKVHDLTLRDGEQMAGVVFDHDDKISIAKRLDASGVDRIEAGNPVISQAERESIKAIAHLGLNAEIYSLSRSIKSDIDMALECGVSGVLMYSPGSELQMEKKLGWSMERALSTPAEVAAYAKSHGLKVAYTAYDTTRSNLNTLAEIYKQVTDVGKVDSIAIFDTVGCITPQAMSYLVSRIREITKLPLEVHAHDDFGMATANTVAAVAAGVGTVQTAVNGLGERCGNASTEEVVVALKLLYGVETNVKMETLYGLSKFVEERSKVALSISKPLVGVNSFRFEAGLVVDGIVKYPLTMEPIIPSIVGQRNTIVLGKKSGKSSITLKLKEAGIASPTEEQVAAVLEKVKKEGETRKRILTDGEFAAIVKETIH